MRVVPSAQVQPFRSIFANPTLHFSLRSLRSLLIGHHLITLHLCISLPVVFRDLNKILTILMLLSALLSEIAFLIFFHDIVKLVGLARRIIFSSIVIIISSVLLFAPKSLLVDMLRLALVERGRGFQQV